MSAHDPQALARARHAHPGPAYHDDFYDAVRGAEAVVICTEWDEFNKLDLKKLTAQMQTPVMFDGRNIFEPAKAKAAGFRHFGVGRK